MGRRIASTVLVLSTLGGVGAAEAQSLCASQKDVETCRKRFGIPEGQAPDAVIVGTIENDRWRFDYRSPSPPEGPRKACSTRGTLTLSRGSQVELWLIADRGAHPWNVPKLGIDEMAFAGSYAPVRIDTSRAGEFPSQPDGKKKPPAIRILEPHAYEAWAAKTLGRHCTPTALRSAR